MTIKHLVLSGGGPTGLITYGAISHLAKKGFWNLKDIESIYGCSIGGYMGVVCTMGYNWDWLDDYFIKRPWEKLVASSAISLMNVYEEKGLVNEHFFTDAIIPLLHAKDLSEHITLAEFYVYNKIDIHLYATNINGDILEKADISHSTHPNLSLIKALRMTMAFPLIFQPIYEDGGCYIDGGLLNNFPLNDCINRMHSQRNEILAFKNIWTTTKQCISEKSSILDFLLIIMKKVQATLDTERIQEEIQNTVRCLIEDLNTFDKWVKALSIEEMRQKIVESGYKHADIFLSSLNLDNANANDINNANAVNNANADYHALTEID
jgi:predicted acylesterase/phospholipase RssA